MNLNQDRFRLVIVLALLPPAVGLAVLLSVYLLMVR